MIKSRLMKLKKAIMNLLAVASIAMASYAGASKITAPSLDKIVHQADACVTAQVVSAKSLMSDAGVITLTKLKVQSVVFGEVGNTVVIRTPGGQLPHTKVPMSESSSNTVSFFSGQRVILLMNKVNNSEFFTIAGYNQGIIDISRGSGAGTGSDSSTNVNDTIEHIKHLKKTHK